MKKKILIMFLITITTYAITACGCSNTNDTLSENNIIETVSENVSENTVSEDKIVEDESDKDIETEESEIDQVFGRLSAQTYLPHALANGETVELMGTTPAEKQYFEYLEEKWLDESWNNEDLAGTIFYEDIFTAINGGIIDRMGATIGDYTETESEMAKVYKGMTPVENEINEDYIAVALCDLAGFNGVNFTAETSIQDAITRDAVCAMAATFERNKAFNTGTYLDANVEGYEGTMEYFNAPATGYDINYAFAVALGLDTENAYDALIEAGYTAFDLEQESVALIDYDKAVIANAKVFAASMNSVAEEESQPTSSTDNSQPTQPTATSQPTQSTDNSQTTPPVDNSQPTQAQEPTQSTTGGYHYNHPEAANMTLTEIDAMIAPFLGDDGLWHWRDDAALWDEDYNTRYQEAVDKGWEIPW